MEEGSLPPETSEQPWLMPWDYGAPLSSLLSWAGGRKRRIPSRGRLFLGTLHEADRILSGQEASSCPFPAGP